MTEKEIGEIRRRFRSEKSNITCIRGCYVNNQKEIVAEINQSLSMMSQDEADELLAVLRKTLSGALDKNIINVEFSTKQVMESDEHKLLMMLRNSALKDDEAINVFYERVISSVNIDSSYVIILACDNYDVVNYTKDGEKMDSTDVFSYIVASICPIKQTKPALGYYPSENLFKNISINWLLSAPQLGFMFPSFDDRTANIYNALYYTHDTKHTVKNVLESCGVADEKLSKFEEKFDDEFGSDAKISPKNIVDVKKFELCTPDVQIKVNPERSDLIQTKTINGVKYIMIRANDGVEVNGINIHINE